MIRFHCLNCDLYITIIENLGEAWSLVTEGGGCALCGSLNWIMYPKYEDKI